VPARSLRKPFPPPGPRLSPRKRKEERIELVQAFKILALRAPSPPPLQPRPRIDHFVMNLPESAIDFLDAFRGFLSPENIGIDAMEIYDVMPMIHCYCFTRELESDKAEVDIRKVRFFFLGAAAFRGVDVGSRGSRNSWGTHWSTKWHFIWCDLSPRVKICIVSASDCPE
jgi:hypothetical protein